ncbi:hypothetical protein [Halpernia sp.]|uniref:hypothetical protein n=1 Tax=Halpernia sp. TaxID=2782209 RepID=UPI003A900E30
MKKKLIITIVFFYSIFGFAQVKDSLRDIILNTSLSREEYIGNQIKLYEDSLISKPKETRFIFNPCFDLNGSFWEDIHHPTTKSYRWEIVKQINNESLLKELLLLSNTKLDDKCKCKNSKDIPLINYSFKGLLKKRYKELKKNPRCAKSPTLSNNKNQLLGGDVPKVLVCFNERILQKKNKM